MFDFNRWIYSKDLAGRLSGRQDISTEEKADCILSALHRTMEEKLEGMRELARSTGSGYASGYIKTMEELIRLADSDDTGKLNWYRIEIYYKGKPLDEDAPCFSELMFKTLKDAVEEIRNTIRTMTEYGDTKALFYGIVYGYSQRIDGALMISRKFVVNSDGKMIYFLHSAPLESECELKEEEALKEIGPCGFPGIKVPYPSGTLAEIPENPFFPSMRGVIVNEKKINETDFSGSGNGQWLICGESYSRQTKGIRVVDLDFPEASEGIFEDTPPFEDIPFYQFIKRYEGKLPENEKWLAQMSKLAEKNRSCMKLILKDRWRISKKKDPDKQRSDYVNNLSKRLVKIKGDKNYNKTNRLLMIFHVFYYCQTASFGAIREYIPADKASDRTIIRDIGFLKQAGLINAKYSQKNREYECPDGVCMVPMDGNYQPLEWPEGRNQRVYMEKIIRLCTLMTGMVMKRVKDPVEWYRERYPQLSERTRVRDFDVLWEVDYRVWCDRKNGKYYYHFPDDF